MSFAPRYHPDGTPDYRELWEMPRPAPPPPERMKVRLGPYDDLDIGPQVAVGAATMQEPVQPPMPAPVEVMPAFPEDEPDVAYDENPERFPAYSVKPPSVEERLQKMIDKSLEDVRTRDARVEASKADAKRAIDAKTLPIIVEDQRKALEHQRMLEAKIEETMAAMSGAKTPQMQRRELGVGQMLALAAAQLMGGGGRAMNQGFGQFTADNREADKMDYANQSAQFELDQSQRELLLRYLTGQLGDVRGDVDRLQGREWNLQDQQTAEANRIADDDRTFARTEMTQDKITGRKAMEIEARRNSDEYKAQLRIITDGLKHSYDLKDPAQKAEAIMRLNEAAALGKIPDYMRDDIARDLSGLTYKQENTEAKTKTENELRPWKVKLEQAKVGKTDADRRLIEKKIETWPQYLQATMARVEIARALASNTIGNTRFDNQMVQWKASGGKRLGMLEKELAGHMKRRAKIDADLAAGKIDGKAAAIELQRIGQREEAIQGEMDKELGNVPVFGGQITGGGVVPDGGTDPNPDRAEALAAIKAGAPRDKVQARYNEIRKKKGLPPEKLP